MTPQRNSAMLTNLANSKIISKARNQDQFESATLNSKVSSPKQRREISKSLNLVLPQAIKPRVSQSLQKFIRTSARFEGDANKIESKLESNPIQTQRNKSSTTLTITESTVVPSINTSRNKKSSPYSQNLGQMITPSISVDNLKTSWTWMRPSD